eukprot:6182018-Pleurochrysis_carterae.AAC.1
MSPRSSAVHYVRKRAIRPRRKLQHERPTTKGIALARTIGVVILQRDTVTETVYDIARQWRLTRAGVRARCRCLAATC